MSVLVVGLSHRSAPVALLERAALTGEPLVKMLTDLHAASSVAEVMAVSTCNRVEVYAAVDRFHGGVAAVSELLSWHTGIPLDELTASLYVHYEDQAVQHLFSVVCGLDSMVVGEGQILGQVREAIKTAQAEGVMGRTLNELGQRALRVGKRAHTETHIDHAGADLVALGLTVAGRSLGPLPGLHTLVVGAGSMSALAASTLARRGVTRLTVANRTHSRAERLAECLGEGFEGMSAQAVPFAEAGAALADADLVISCTGAQGTVITADAVRSALAGRPERPLVLLDLALPHDVDPAAAQVPGAVLVNLAELQAATADRGADAAGRAADIQAVRAIVADEVAAFLTEQRTARVAPTIVALRGRAKLVVDAEIERLQGRLPGLDDRTRGEITRALRRVADKLLHQPTVRVKELAGGPGGDSYEAALRELFALDTAAPDAVSRARIDDLRAPEAARPPSPRTDASPAGGPPDPRP
ncbi:glutamyl-tRNA reductase [Allonocardiopsis opalescens]|uniref:Glutamyl-tRNA reductase n=1 Tax=Allonocardiopsis opalescens TaxID=1144618 RepID=A0A2T0Q7W5_9ACTN|nr:glutamyl-tRNA reductase [Allonocardiopsis opalescens]PRX99881.1 glutamyl-tRNA reductase [Allonocardiopsis opalescens]